VPGPFGAEENLTGNLGPLLNGTPGREYARLKQWPLLAFLADAGAISQALRAKLLGWTHSGFSVHNQVRVDERDAEGRGQLARYMLRAPLSLEKMTYDAATGTVISARRCTERKSFATQPPSCGAG
jgi:hypothetical protein